MRLMEIVRRAGFFGAALAAVLFVIGGAASAVAAEIVAPDYVLPAGTEMEFGGTYSVDVQTGKVTFVPPDTSPSDRDGKLRRVGADVAVYDNISRVDLNGGSGHYVSMNPIYGDRVLLTGPGELDATTYTFFTSGGSLYSGTFTYKLYDATGWAGTGFPAVQIVEVETFIDFVAIHGAGGSPDFLRYVVDLTNFPDNIRIPQDVLLTQQMISYAGDPTFFGAWATTNETPFTGGSDPTTSFFANDEDSPSMLTWATGSTNNFEYLVTACTTTEIQVGTPSITASVPLGEDLLLLDVLEISNVNGCVPLDYSITSDCGMSSPAGTVLAGAVGFVTLYYNPVGVAPGTYNGTVNILSNDPVMPTASVPVTYTVLCTTTVVQVVTPSVTASAPLGEDRFLLDVLEISNVNGCTPLDYSITSDCEMSAPPGTVPPGAVGFVSLYYYPFGIAPGTHNGVVNILSNDPVTPIVSIPVTYSVTGTLANATPNVAYATQGPSGSANWVKIDLLTGAGTDLGWTRYPMSGLGVTADGSIFGSGPSDSFWQIDAATGTLVHVAVNGCMEAMASNGLGNIIGLDCNGDLYEIDPDTGSLSAPILTGISPAMGGLAVDPTNSVLYFTQADAGPGTDNLYGAFPFPGSVPILQGSLGLGLPIGDIAFDEAGNLYGIVGNVGGPTYLVSIVKNTGVATVIGETGIDNLDALVIFGTDGVSAVPEDNIPMPTAFALHGASPNPFNPTTEISFDLPAAGDVQLTVYDVSGRRISTLVNGQMQAGRHSVRFSGDRLGSGTYFYELRGNGNREIGKMVLLK